MGCDIKKLATDVGDSIGGEIFGYPCGEPIHWSCGATKTLPDGTHFVGDSQEYGTETECLEACEIKYDDDECPPENCEWSCSARYEMQEEPSVAGEPCDE